MSWFFLAIIAPFLYSMTNHIDKILLEKYFKNGGVGTLILVSSLLAGLALPILYFLDPTIASVSGFNMFILAVSGILNIGVLWLYFLALKDEEASIVIVFYQLVPVFGLGLGYFILGEVLTELQLIAMAIIILGTTIISFEIDDENNFKLRKLTIVLMTTASFLWALESVLFKYVALEENVLRSLFFEHLMLLLVGIIIFVCVRSYRTHFITAIKTNSVGILSLNVLNESLYTLGNVVLAFAYILAPIALVLLTNSFQPIFVFAIGVFLTLCFPKLTVERIEVQHVLQKLLAIIITGIGTYLLLM